MRRLIKMGIALTISISFFLSGLPPWIPTAPAFAQPWGSTAPAFVQPWISTDSASAEGTNNPPNILMIMSDDVGWFNISAYNNGIMGYSTPNIDKIAQDGILFTDAYAENSCTAGRSAFVTGQSPGRTGLTKVGLPGFDFGLSDKDITLAEVLKEEGYATGQFGKNHLGDLDKFLPTNHGFEQFFGNLYHLNAEEEPENPDYPNNSDFVKKFGPKGVLLSYDTRASDVPTIEQLKAKTVVDNEGNSKPLCESVYDSNDTETPQRICNTGPLTSKRMENVDEEFRDVALDFMDRSVTDNKPFFVWFNPTRMHVFTHLKPGSEGVTGQGIYADGMVEHDALVGDLLDKLDELGVKDNTIVIYTTDNGAEVFSWPDGGMTPFHGEKNTNWEGGFRVPMVARWPSHWGGGVVSNDIISLMDWFPTLTEATGIANIANIKEQLLGSCVEVGDPAICDPEEEIVYYANGKHFKPLHLDGYDFLPYLNGTDTTPPRDEFFYLTDDGYPSALRFDDWKMIFAEQRAIGFDVWAEPYVKLRLPIILNLRRDPFEIAPEESEYYSDWRFRHSFLVAPAQAYVGQFLKTFEDYPPRQLPASFTIDGMLQDLLESLQSIKFD